MYVGKHGTAKTRPNMHVNGRCYPVARVILACKGKLSLKDRRQLACHTCDNEMCIRPSPLYTGTRRSNMMDAVKRGQYPTGPDHHNWKVALHDE